MFDITRDADGIIHIEISGQIDSEAMRKGLDRFLDLVGKEGPIDAVYLARDISMPTAGAIAVEFGYLPKLFGLIGRMRRIALVSNQGWVRGWAKVESAFIPGLVIECFEPGEEDRALAYAKGEHAPA